MLNLLCKKALRSCDKKYMCYFHLLIRKSAFRYLVTSEARFDHSGALLKAGNTKYLHTNKIDVKMVHDTNMVTEYVG